MRPNVLQLFTRAELRERTGIRQPIIVLLLNRIEAAMSNRTIHGPPESENFCSWFAFLELRIRRVKVDPKEWNAGRDFSIRKSKLDFVGSAPSIGSDLSCLVTRKGTTFTLGSRYSTCANDVVFSHPYDEDRVELERLFNGRKNRSHPLTL